MELFFCGRTWISFPCMDRRRRTASATVSYTHLDVYKRQDYSNGFANQANVDYNMNFMKTYARDGSMMTNLTPDRINSPEEFQSYYKEVFDVIYTLDYLQGKAYLQLTPEQQARITLQHRYGTTNNHQKWNSANSTWRTIGAGELENMNLKTLDDLWDNQDVYKRQTLWSSSLFPMKK